MKKLVIVGAGGFGRETAWLVERINAREKEWDLLGFADDTPELTGKTVNGYPVLGTTEWLKNQKDDIYVLCAVGSAKTRKKIVSRLGNVKYATLIDPGVILSDSVKIGKGSIICAGSILTVNIQIGSHVIINLDCTIGHDAVMKDYVTLYPSVNVSGATLLNECVEMGTGSKIIEKKTVGENSIVGSGAVVVKDLPAGCTAVGMPAKPIKFHNN